MSALYQKDSIMINDQCANTRNRVGGEAAFVGHSVLQCALHADLYAINVAGRCHEERFLCRASESTVDDALGTEQRAQEFAVGCVNGESLGAYIKATGRIEAQTGRHAIDSRDEIARIPGCAFRIQIENDYRVAIGV